MEWGETPTTTTTQTFGLSQTHTYTHYFALENTVFAIFMQFLLIFVKISSNQGTPYGKLWLLLIYPFNALYIILYFSVYCKEIFCNCVLRSFLHTLSYMQSYHMNANTDCLNELWFCNITEICFVSNSG